MVVVLHHVCRCRLFFSVNIFTFEHDDGRLRFRDSHVIAQWPQHCILKRVDHNFLRKCDGNDDKQRPAQAMRMVEKCERRTNERNMMNLCNIVGVRLVQHFVNLNIGNYCRCFCAPLHRQQTHSLTHTQASQNVEQKRVSRLNCIE